MNKLKLINVKMLSHITELGLVEIITFPHSHSDLKGKTRPESEDFRGAQLTLLPIE